MLHTLLMILKWLSIVLVLIGMGVALFLRWAPTFGATPDDATMARIKRSPNFNGNTFVNLTTTTSLADISALPAPDQTSPANASSNTSIWSFIFPPAGKNPTAPITTVPLDLIDADQPDTTTLTDGEFVWLGHSTVLFKTGGMLVMTDPVFHNASPLPIGVAPFAMTPMPQVADLPYIDAVLISHDHYDHLDHRAIKKLRGRVGHFYVPLGVKAHLQRWGVADDKVSEYDWYDRTPLNSKTTDEDIAFTFAPARHFSGRRLTGQKTTLWGSWIIESETLRVYFSGDGGYSDEFAKIGEDFGGFDIAFIEDGAYNVNWRAVHMLPEESAQAGIDLKAKVVLPIHWGKFDLSTHHWREPIRRFNQAIHHYNDSHDSDARIEVATPRIGQVFDLDHLPIDPWWEQMD